MNCPHCRTTLLMSERQGVEIDYCPDCRGVWLDRGELDKIIARSSAETFRDAPPPPVASGKPDDDRGDADWKQLGATLKDVARSSKGAPAHRDDDMYGKKPYGKKKKRTSFLEDIFDF